MLSYLMRMFVPYYTLVLWGVCFVHIGQAAALLLDGNSVGTTSILGLVQNHPGDWVPIAIPYKVLAVMYIVGAAMAIKGVTNDNGSALFHYLMWGPQQVLVLFAVMSAAEAIWVGHYLDGVGSPESGISISRSHMFSDQWIYLVFGFIHFVGFFMWRHAVNRGHHVIDYYQRLESHIQKGSNDSGNPDLSRHPRS